MKKIWLVTLLLCLVGCSKDETLVTNVCQGSNGEVILISLGNELQTMTEQDIYTFEDLSVTASFMSKEENQQQLLENYKALYASITKGLDITMIVEETQVVFNITIDFTIADFTELANVGIITDPSVKYISLEDTIEQMQLTCTKKE